MMNENERTLQVYNQHFDRYIEGTPSIVTTDNSQGEWIRYIVNNHLTMPASVLEIGSAHGRDARYMTSLGLNVQASDATDAALAYLKLHGFPDAKKLDVLQDKIDGQYDLIYAAAVFLHFTEDQLRSVMEKLASHIKSSGVLAFSVKQGEGEEWQDHKMGAMRYFKFWQSAELGVLINETGYNIVDERVLDNGKWLHYVCRREDGD